MAITSYAVTRLSSLVNVTVVSSLTGTIYYHWYIDGAWAGMTLTPSNSFRLEPEEVAEIICQDTTSATYDWLANAPAGYPARRTLFFLRAFDRNPISKYRIQAAKGKSKPAENDWETIGHVADTGAWSYYFVTPILDDLTWYWFRVQGEDEAGNIGDPLLIGPEYVMRKPDGVGFVATHVPADQKVAFAAA